MWCLLSRKKPSTLFPLSLNKNQHPYVIIHYQECGSSKVFTLEGSLWFVTFINDCNMISWVRLIKFKSEVNLLFWIFFSYKMVESQYKKKVHVLHSDNWKEY